MKIKIDAEKDSNIAKDITILYKNIHLENVLASVTLEMKYRNIFDKVEDEKIKLSLSTIDKIKEVIK